MASNEKETGVPQSETGAEQKASKKGTDDQVSTSEILESAEGERESLELSEAELRDVAGGGDRSSDPRA